MQTSTVNNVVVMPTFLVNRINETEWFKLNGLVLVANKDPRLLNELGRYYMADKRGQDKLAPLHLDVDPVRIAFELKMMSKWPYGGATAAIGTEEAHLLWHLASGTGTEWQSGGVKHATAQHLMDEGLIERDQTASRLLLTEQGLALFAAWLDVPSFMLTEQRRTPVYEERDEDPDDDLLWEATMALYDFVTARESDPKKTDHAAKVRACYSQSADASEFEAKLVDAVEDWWFEEMRRELPNKLENALRSMFEK